MRSAPIPKGTGAIMKKFICMRCVLKSMKNMFCNEDFLISYGHSITTKYEQIVNMM